MKNIVLFMILNVWAIQAATANSIAEIRIDVDVPNFTAEQRKMYQSYLYVVAPIINAQRSILIYNLESSISSFTGKEDALRSLRANINNTFYAIDVAMNNGYTSELKKPENHILLQSAIDEIFGDASDLADDIISSAETLYECTKTSGGAITNDCIVGVVEQLTNTVIAFTRLGNLLYFWWNSDDYKDALNSYRIAEAYINLSIKAGYFLGENTATIEAIANELGLRDGWYYSDYDVDIAINAMKAYRRAIETTKDHYTGAFLQDIDPKPTNVKPYRPVLSVSGGDFDVSLTPTLRASGWSDPDAEDYHAETWWAVRDANTKIYVRDFGWNSYDKYTKQIPQGVLEPGREYEALVAFKDNHGNYSYASVVRFKTKLRDIQVENTDFLNLPLSGYSHSTAPISSFFDHDSTVNSVTLFTGEVADKNCIGSSKVYCQFSGAHDFNYDYYNLNTSRSDKSYIHYDSHKGVDYFVSKGTGVRSSADGVVVFAGWQNAIDHYEGYGKYIKIYHYNGFATYYAHLDSINVNVGDSVAQGQIIGTTGNTGNSSAEHLHFGVRKNCASTWPHGCPKSGRIDPFGGNGSSALWADWYAATSTGLSMGDRVKSTAVNGLRIRSCAGTACAIIDTAALGSKGTIVDGPISANGYQWWKINYDGMLPVGWSAGAYLEKLVEASAPDLLVTGIGASDYSLNPGASFTINSTVENIGNSNADSTTLRYYYSADSTVNPSDVYIGSDYVSMLSPGEASMESALVQAPNEPGSYWIGACVEEVLGEVVMQNNCSVGAVITVEDNNSEKDFFIENPVIDGNQVSALLGSNIYVTSDVCYMGPDPDNASAHIGYYLSNDIHLDSGDVLLLEDSLGYWYEGLTCRNDDGVRITLDEEAVSSGKKYLLISIDDNNIHAESNESNNIGVLSLNVVMPDHDIYPTDQVLNVGKSSPGGKVIASYVERYSGNSPYRIFTDFGYYLSSDTTFDSGDVLLATESSSLGRGDFDDPESEELVIPNVSHYGLYYVLFVSDRFREIPETNEYNNVVYYPLNILDPSPMKSLKVNVLHDGVVKSSPPGINCPPACSASFAANSTITLTTEYPSNWDAAMWSWNGACSGNSSCVIHMDEDQCVDIEFQCLLINVGAPFQAIDTVLPAWSCDSLIVEPGFEIGGNGRVTFNSKNGIELRNNFKVGEGGSLSITLPGDSNGGTPPGGNTGGNSCGGPVNPGTP